ncbi:MAG: hypothetical protein WCP55_20525 [Lentisphaerota bacterium]
MFEFVLKDGTTLIIDGDTISSNDPLFEKLARLTLAGTFGRFDCTEVHPNKEGAIAEFLYNELNLKRRI